ncbi:DNA repair protein RAD50-like [Ornithodoros turicata]|uniref:DNA repair protein RAD50-like n=1 Tax=Ornithodoros turicata TaxID=34597 RepID=UPI0031398C3F
MSMLEKLQVQGIRSFGPKEEHKQVMAFASPVTFILGCNGTGKTTIIECLRNATTGDLPPGQGKVFINDPKLSGEREVNAQIKLMFRDVRGKQNIVTRSFNMKQNKTNTTTFKTVDTALVQHAADGSKLHVTPKCMDVSATITELLGVPRPILDNVIFCHQADSCWPLSEGLQLKTKFDNIFAATQYLKLLDSIRQLKKEYDAEVHVLSKTMVHLAKRKERAQEYENEIKTCTRQLEEGTTNRQQAEEKLADVVRMWEEIEKKETRTREIQASLKAEQDKLDGTRSMCERIKKNLKEIYDGPAAELKRQIEDFEAHMEAQKRSLENLQRESRELALKVNNLVDEKSELLPLLGQLESEKRATETATRALEDRMDKLNDRLGLRLLLPKQSPVAEKASSVLYELNETVKEAQRNLEDSKKDRDIQVKEQQDRVDNLREQKSKSEQRLESTRRQVSENQKEIMQIRRELLQAETYCSQIRGYENEIRDLQGKVGELEAEIPTDSIREKIDASQKLKDELRQKLELLSKELVDMQKFSAEQAEIEHVRKELDEKRQSLESTKDEVRSKFEELLGSLPSADYAAKVKTKVRSIEDRVSTLRSECNKLQASESSLETRRRMLQEDLKKKEIELDKIRKKIVNVCGSEDLDDSIAELNLTIAQLRDEKGCLTGSEFIFKRYVTRMKKDSKPCCPLCKRGFNDAKEARKLTDYIEEKIQIIPNELERMTRELSEKEASYNEMIRLKGDEEKMSKLRLEVPDLQQQIETITVELETSKKLRSEKEEALDVEEVFNLETARSLVREAETIDRLESEAASCQRKLASKSPSVRKLKPGRTAEVVAKEIKDFNKRVKELDDAVTTYRARLEEHQQLKMALNEVQSTKLRLESKMKEESHLRDRKAKLEEENEKSKVAESGLVREGNGLERELRESMQAKEAIVKDAESRIEELRNRINVRRAEKEEIEKSFSTIAAFSKSGKLEKLNDVRLRLSTFQDKIDALEKQKAEKDASITQFQKNLSNEELRERELKDNLQLHELRVETVRREARIKEIQEQLDSLEVRNLQLEKRRVADKMQTLREEREYYDVRCKEQRIKIEAARRELTGHFKDAKKEYVQDLCKMKLKERLSKEQDMYYRAVNYAVLQYHEQKMKDINKVIRQLWQETYSGDDIEYIKIKTEADDKGLANSKRSCNYRVVMVRGNVEQDMRGRCSAGQKVMASIIIRLALAETFCHNCGILALDEPTTNLDRANIRGLAVALANIIKERMVQKNFQMIIITHDEEFLRALSQRLPTSEYFYKVEKSSLGYTTIRKHLLSTIM